MTTSRTHPYRGLPDRAYWRRSVSRTTGPIGLTGASLFRDDDRVMSAGSCFASNLVPWLLEAGITYVRTEPPHPSLEQLPENLGYREFSAAYGNMYTVRQFTQLIDRARGRFSPAEDRWNTGEAVIDPFRPGLKYPARSDGEFDALTRQHLACVSRALDEATVVVFTLGLTETWRSTVDGAIFPVAPGVIAGTFDSTRHEFANLTYQDVLDDLTHLRKQLDEFDSRTRLVLTVSPVPLVATASDCHVLTASTYSKSVLRAAAGRAAETLTNVEYFPAYEIVTGPQAPGSYFEDDARTVSPEGIEAVMRAMLGRPDADAPRRTDAERATAGAEANTQISESMRLSQLIADAECEEALLDDA